MQDIWLAVRRALPGFRGDCSERTFIYRIAHNRALTHAGRSRAATAPLEEALDVLDPGASVEDHLQAANERAQARAALIRVLQQDVEDGADMHDLRRSVQTESRRLLLTSLVEYAVGTVIVGLVAWKLATDKGPDTFVTLATTCMRAPIRSGVNSRG